MGWGSWGGGVVERFSLKCGEPADWWSAWVIASSAKLAPIHLICDWNIAKYTWDSNLQISWRIWYWWFSASFFQFFSYFLRLASVQYDRICFICSACDLDIAKSSWSYVNGLSSFERKGWRRDVRLQQNPLKCTPSRMVGLIKYVTTPETLVLHPVSLSQLRALTHQAYSRPSASVRPSVSIFGASFCSVFRTFGTGLPSSMAFGACWMSIGAHRWEKSLLAAV